jgi:hypothetical protein
LRGDSLGELTDAEREWVWRSLLTSVRLEASAALAGLSEEGIAAALAAIQARYDQRIAGYKRRRFARSEALPQSRTTAARHWPFRRLFSPTKLG